MWWLCVPLALLVVAIWRFRKYRKAQNRQWRLQRYYDRAVGRVEGKWPGNGADGDEFLAAEHPYARDLNVFGEGSLFELLCIARSAIGRRGLAQYLLSAPALEEILLRQAAVQELKEQAELRERVALAGEFEAHESKWETFADWVDLPVISFPKALRVVAFISSVALACLLLCGLFRLVAWPGVAQWLMPFLALHALIGMHFRDRIHQMIASLGALSIESQVLREGLQLLEAHEFQSPKLRQLVDRIQGSAKSVRKLERLMDALAERNKDWFYLPSLIFLAGTQLCMAIEDWRMKHGAELRVWIDVWGEFEALSALANYAYENPMNTFPVVSGDVTKYEAEGLGHPLLASEACVRNDVRLNRDCRFYVISGSNMSGKSTLLRAIGLNAVLAFAGAPVRATELRLSRLAVCSSLSIMDSLQQGKSKFMAEMDRLRMTIEMAEQGEPVLFLIDEIFSGTNSRDRRVAAEAVVRTLINRGAIGALSTHDLALTEIASPELCGTNVHTCSRDGSDPMDFDYLLKQGVTTEANALAIARLAGVPV